MFKILDAVKDCNEDDTKPTQYYVEMSYANHIQRLLKSRGWDTDSLKSLHSKMESSTSNFNSTTLIESNWEDTLNTYYFEYVTKLCSLRPLYYSLSAAETVSASKLIDASSTADQVENIPFKLVDVSVTMEQVRIAMFKILVKLILCRISVPIIMIRLVLSLLQSMYLMLTKIHRVYKYALKILQVFREVQTRFSRRIFAVFFGVFLGDYA